MLSFDNTIAGMALVPISAYALGLVRHDTYAQQTAELAAEALIDTAIPSLVIRDIARRLPPGSIPPNGKFDDSWFRSHRGPFYLGPGGFPSGHTMAAFSIATIFAESYGRHRWVPWVAYGVAGPRRLLPGHAASTLSSDVFVGAVLGFTISH